ncbi:hypothetical protein BD779DRAFT_262431 [Infundibulicybe gibba]|nr:hypothetical protein BD779DRAFT_262431 [Infundibulicybe gibba]
MPSLHGGRPCRMKSRSGQSGCPLQSACSWTHHCCIDMLPALAQRMMGLKRTRRMVDKLMRWTIQTGALTVVVSLAIVLTKNLDTKDNTYLWLGIVFILPNCYATGLLALLNARTSLDELNTDI